MDAAQPAVQLSLPKDGIQRIRAGAQEALPELASRGFDQTTTCWYTNTPTILWLLVLAWCPQRYSFLNLVCPMADDHERNMIANESTLVYSEILIAN